MRTRRPLNRGASSLFALILAALLGVSMTVSDVFPSPRARTPEVLLDAAASHAQLAQAVAPTGEKKSDCEENITKDGKTVTVGANVSIDSKGTIGPETPNAGQPEGKCKVGYKDEHGNDKSVTMTANDLNKLAKDGITHADVEDMQDVINRTQNSLDELNQELGNLQKALKQLAKQQNDIIADIRQLSTHANETTTALSQYKEKLNNIEQKQTYIVKAGDTLEKIARKFNISIDEIKSLNQIKDDLIIVGDEITVSR